jgi:hypothetical protein
MRRYGATLLLLMFLDALVASSQVPNPDELAGTYEVLICRGGCADWDTSRAHVRGRFVLVESSLPQKPQDPFRINGIPNGCFVLSHVLERRDSYAGMWTDGFFHWQRASSGNAISFPIYVGVDAGYDLTLWPVSGGFRGVGHSWGVGVAEIHFPDDSAAARRIGPPEVVLCGTVR